MRKLVEEARLQHAIHIDSAGTHAYHVGHAPDERSQRFARKRGYELALLRARQVSDEDFERFDLLLAMDWDNLHLLEAACPPAQRHKLKLLMSYATRSPSLVVPDPYYGGDRGFEQVLDYAIDGCEGLLTHLISPLSAAKI